MSDNRLADIKARFTTTPDPYPETVEGWYDEDVPWLVGEVERLRGLLARLEWAGQPTPGTRIGAQPRCPVCRETEPPHDRGCWLASELGR